MSKSDTPLDYIDTTRAKNQLGQPSFAGDTPINGFDTETADGDIFAIGMWLGGDRNEYLERTKQRALTSAEVLELLTYRPLKDSLNFWYNLNFDANVVLKFLPKENLQQLNLQNSTEWETSDGITYRFTYIPKKVLKIRNLDHNQTYAHYDISQFTYSGSLESAVEDWLDGESGKADDNLDVEQFGKQTGPVPEGEQPEVNGYIKENWADIRHYLKEDCRLTQAIAQEVVHTAEQEVEPPIPMGKPYSTGYIAADYVRNRNEYGLKYEPHAIQKPFWKAYRGGRFEVIKRGAVGDVAGPDINSAYPAVMADLPNPGTLEWELYKQENGPFKDPADLTLDTVKAADYGAVKVNVTTDPERPVQPFAVSNPEHNGRVEYPALKNVTLWVLKETLEYAIEVDLVTEYELKGAALGHETDETEQPFSWIPELYDKRKRLEDSGRDRQAKLIKIVLNSLYGKTCQTQLKLKQVENADELPKMPEGFDPATDPVIGPESVLPDAYSLEADMKTGDPFIEYQESGSLFNPFIASYITGMTRLKLLKGTVDNGLEDNVVMLATDCLMFEKEAFEGSALEEAADREADTYADALGGWDYDYVGDGFVVGSGVYEVDRYDKDELKQGLRGFTDFHSSGYESLKDGFQQDPDGLDLTSTRPLTYGDVLHLNRSPSAIGRFVDSARSLNPDMDSKRRWPGEVDGLDLVNGCQDSEPKRLVGAKGRAGWIDD